MEGPRANTKIGVICGRFVGKSSIEVFAWSGCLMVVRVTQPFIRRTAIGDGQAGE